MRKATRLLFPLLSIVVIVASILIAASIGVVKIPFPNIIKIILGQLGLADASGLAHTEVVTIWELRLPRILMSLTAGAALAICGAVFQSIFRNPICDPYILGISSGASLGAATAFILGWDAFLFGITLPALVTALLTLLVIMGIARLSRQKTTHTLLLTGIAINFLISAVITLLMVINQKEMHKIIFWTMGSCAGTTWNDILFLLPFLIVIAIVLLYYAKDLNIMQLGTDTAQTLGVNVKAVTYITLITSSLLIAVVVAICGVIGFIGLIIPHAVRLMVGSDNRLVFSYSLLLGALFLLIADTLARTIAIPAELPVGSITAIAGAPYFIFLLLKKQ
ncbi:MAG: iron ABC transporter permease [Bacteroidales bacterium]|nr:iron ABC transporter permease [Bacteroidales bacterium]